MCTLSGPLEHNLNPIYPASERDQNVKRNISTAFSNGSPPSISGFFAFRRKVEGKHELKVRTDASVRSLRRELFNVAEGFCI